MSAYARALKKPPFSLNLPSALYVSGAPICGEVDLDLELVREDDIEKICVQVRGTILTKNRKGAGLEEFKVDVNQFLRKTVTLWARERSPPPGHGGVLQIPFELRLPSDAPPSFGFESYMNNAHVRYALEVTGVRSGTFATDRAVKVPIVVIEPDPIGSGTRAQLKLGWQGAWGRLKVEDNIRKYPWGEYSTVKMELLVPHVDTFPLFTDIPYTIIITTLSAPVKRKDGAGPEKNLFPPVPRSPSEIDFELRRFVDMDTPYKPSNPEEHVVDIISKAHAPIPPVEVVIGEYIWVPEDDRPDRGRWMQEATFHSSVNLRFTPTFLTEELKIKYHMLLRVEFPGTGNMLRLVLPINIGSGVESSIPIDQHPGAPVWKIDLPATYWDPYSWTDQ